MQTFLPYQDFVNSAKVLDNKRLGKQRVEVIQILKALTVPEYGWKNHPATRMWMGSELWLCNYGHAVCDEWISRGYKDSCKDQISDIAESLNPEFSCNYPSWLGDEKFHRSHRSNLTRKNPEHYSQFWNEPDDLEYVWPTPEWEEW